MKMKTRAEIRTRLKHKLSCYLEEIARRDKERDAPTAVWKVEYLRNDCEQRQSQIEELLWVLGWRPSEVYEEIAAGHADIGERVQAYETAVIAAVRKETQGD